MNIDLQTELPIAAALPPTHHEWLAQRPFTLVLTAGYFGFFAHTGMLSALLQAGLVPRRVIGVSGGSVTGGLWAAGVQIDVIAEMLHALDRRAFWDPGIPLGGLLRGDKLDAQLRRLLAVGGNERLERTPVPFTPVVFDPLGRRTVGLRWGDTATAIRASCAVPFLFRPVWIDRRPLLDGGLRDPLGQSVVEAGERLLIHDVTRNGATDELARDECLSFRIEDLTRAGAFRLSEGLEALEHARLACDTWLKEPLG